MRMRRLFIGLCMATVLGLSAAFAAEPSESLINPPDAHVRVRLESEVGFLSFLHHTFTAGPDAGSADTIDYVKEGGQDILFPFLRYTATLDIGERHHLRFLYQPLEVNTRTNFKSPRKIGDQTFDGPVALTYSFPFWRLGYSYDFISGPRWTMGGGGVLQLRNASIVFESLDSSGAAPALFVGQGPGPVPALKLTGRYDHPAGWFAGFEAVGFYASSAFINGASYDFEGSILDSSLRAGLRLKGGFEPFLNLRFLGGTAKGTSESADDTWTGGAAYTSNYLATWSLSIGATLR